MFITLKSSNNSSDTGMEPVASRTANLKGSNSRLRPARKTACVACQSRKLRCSGGTVCHRCKISGVPCVFIPSARPARHHEPNAGNSALSPVQGVAQAITPSNSSPASQQSPDALVEQDSLLSPQGPIDRDLDQYLIDHEKLIHLDTETGFALPNADMFLTGLTLPNGDSPGVEEATAHPPPTPNNASIPQSQQQHETNQSAQGEQQYHQTSPDNASCTCIDDTIRIVQQLDDDEFKLTRLSLDQALQLHKWLIFQCCKPLDCTRCTNLLAAHTVILVVCDRLSEMFECIHKRIRRASAALTGVEFPECSTSPSDPSRDAHLCPRSASAQLFDSETGDAAWESPCNPLIFSGDIREAYSEEEQFHMIGVLLKFQCRNFRKLLARVGEHPQQQGSGARRARVTHMVARLEESVAAIEAALRAVSRAFASI